jgi:hypothetical protein
MDTGKEKVTVTLNRKQPVAEVKQDTTEEKVVFKDLYVFSLLSHHPLHMGCCVYSTEKGKATEELTVVTEDQYVPILLFCSLLIGRVLSFTEKERARRQRGRLKTLLKRMVTQKNQVT